MTHVQKMDSYAIYRLENWAWVEDYQRRMGEREFREYRDNVYKKLLEMKVNTSFNIEEKVREENRELFVKLCCSFIQEGHPGYSFSDNYKIIKCHEKTALVGAR